MKLNVKYYQGKTLGHRQILTNSLPAGKKTLLQRRYSLDLLHNYRKA